MSDDEREQIDWGAFPFSYTGESKTGFAKFVAKGRLMSKTQHAYYHFRSFMCKLSLCDRKWE